MSTNKNYIASFELWLKQLNLQLVQLQEEIDHNKKCIEMEQQSIAITKKRMVFTVDSIRKGTAELKKYKQLNPEPAKPKHFYRSAITGKDVTRAYALKHPKTTNIRTV